MNVILNGKKINIEKNTNLKKILVEKGFDIEIIGIEYNDNFINKNKIDTIYLKENDKIEIFSFVDGG